MVDNGRPLSRAPFARCLPSAYYYHLIRCWILAALSISGCGMTCLAWSTTPHAAVVKSIWPTSGTRMSLMNCRVIVAPSKIVGWNPNASCLVRQERLSLWSSDDQSFFPISATDDERADEDDVPLSDDDVISLPEGSPKGFYVVKQYRMSEQSLDWSRLDLREDDDVDRLELTPPT
jgi:hypothetical protein